MQVTEISSGIRNRNLSPCRCSKFTRKGFCKNGDQCKYAHGKDELREPILHQGSLSHSSSDSLGESLADLPDLPDRSHTSHISHISHSSGYLHDEGLNQLPLLTQDFPEDFVVKGERKDEEMSSDETCTPSPDSSSVASVDWSPQSTESSLMSEAHVRIKNTFLEFGCPTESTDTLRRSSSVPDLRLPVA